MRRRRLLYGWLFGCCLVFLTQPSAAESCQQEWLAWDVFQERMITEEGRVIDFSDPRQITTSEGQSYALFFALVNNDPVLFRRLVEWTEKNLAKGDLTAHLPAWLWGRTEQGEWKVLDNNSAADSDLWIAYSLLEAGRLWQQRSYTVLGHLLLQRIAKEEIVNLPEFGAVLLPGKQGFAHEEYWILNPSYVPPQLVLRAQSELPQSQWSALALSTPNFLKQTAPLALAPDWARWEKESWQFNEAAEQIGSYDAIRVYLWLGMLEKGEDWLKIKRYFKQALPYLDQQGMPAERVNVLNGQTEGLGPVGFSAALLPLFAETPFGEKQRQRVKETNLQQLGYYNFMLYLFGLGWDEQRFSFDANGYLMPAWMECK